MTTAEILHPVYCEDNIDITYIRLGDGTFVYLAILMDWDGPILMDSSVA